LSIGLLVAVLGIFAVLGGRVQAAAQSAADAAQVVKALDSNSKAVVGRLTELNQLPAEEWRFHAGDLAHGEATELDDSSWPVVKAGTDAPMEAVWYRRWIEVPQTFHGYDLTGARIWFSFFAGANGPMPEIIYFNGRRVALGDDLEPIVLFDKVKPGEKVLVAVKLLHTVDKKSFGGTELKIDFAENRPNPEDLRKEILTAALMVPSMSTNVAADTATVEKAAGAVDLAALDAKDQTKFDASLKQAQTNIEALKPLLQQATMHLTGNAHIDAAWLWPWTETVDVVKRTFGTALQLMNEYPDYTFSQSAAAYNEWIATKYPEMNAQIKQRIKEGRWEIVGGMWVEPDLNMPDGEAQVRSILVGKRWFQKEYGVDVRIGWNPDSFGYTWQLPQIYKRSGMDYFVTQKTGWNDTNQFPFKLFWWESPDGSKVLTYFPHDYANNNLNPVRLANDFTIARATAPGLTKVMDLYGIGDHGGGPTRAILDEGVHWMQADKVVPKMKFGTAQSYFDEVESKLVTDSHVWDYDSIAKGYIAPATPAEGKISIPTWKSELYFEYHRGVMTTQANHKRNMRDSEEQAINAEKLASLAWLEGKPYPGDVLTDAWKIITFNGFHDLAAGSGIGIIYKEAQQQYDQVRLETSDISEQALKTLSAGINTQVTSGVPVLVMNPLAWERSGAVTVDVQLPAAASSGVSVLDALNHVVPSQVIEKDAKTNTYKLQIAADKIPSLGYKVLHVVPGTRPVASDLKADGLTLENSALKVTVDKTTGCITSLYDKQTKFETLAAGACGNQLQTFKDLPKDYDAWNVDYGTFDQFTAIDKADSVELVEKGPMHAAIRVTRTWQSSKFVQDITLDAGADQVDVVNDIDWHETHVMLKAAFPLAATSNKATYEVPYGTIQRPTTRNNSWEKAQFEVPVLRWADLGDGQHGFSLLNNSKYGYDDKDNVLRISLLRSPVWPDPDADRGHHHFTYALYPHAGDWKQAMTVRHGYEYNYRLTATQVQSHTGSLPADYSYVTVKPENVVLTALKKAEDENGLIFRVYEWAGKSGDVEIHLPKGATGATVTNLMEKPEGTPLKVVGDTVTAPIHPYEILTICVGYPAQR
jgi:alpha-mannosidase